MFKQKEREGYPQAKCWEILYPISLESSLKHVYSLSGATGGKGIQSKVKIQDILQDCSNYQKLNNAKQVLGNTINVTFGMLFLLLSIVI